MRIKLDENIPARLTDALVQAGHEVDSVASEGLTGKQDARIWEAARKEARFLITQDLDFSDVRRFRPGTHAGLLLVRLREPGANSMLKHIASMLAAHPLETLAGCFVVLTERKIRIRRP